MYAYILMHINTYDLQTRLIIILIVNFSIFNLQSNFFVMTVLMIKQDLILRFNIILTIINVYMKFTIDFSKITKLSQEQQNLQKSCEAIISLNQRLQVIGMCTHAIHRKNETKIKDLEYMLASMSVRNAEFTDKLVKYDVHPEK